MTSVKKKGYYKDFMESKSSKFCGQISSTIVIEWVRQMEKPFEAMDVPDCEERVRLASQCFEDQAEAWWLSLRAQYAVQHMRWETFNQHFYKEHFRRSERNALRK